MSKDALMTRHKGREQAFVLLFDKCFTDDTIEQILENAKAVRDFDPGDFALEIVKGVQTNLQTIDSVIEKNLKGWKITRLPKVTLCILRIATYEILYDESIPVSVSINEAVEFAKEYATKKDSQFVNGILGVVAKSKS